MEFPETFLRATLTVSLLTVWVLVGLFAYLNRYTKREYFTIWTVAWLFYALWLTLTQHWQSDDIRSVASMVKQSSVAISAAFLLWGTLRFLDLPVPQRLFGLFITFLVAWTFFIPRLATSLLQIQLPVFILLGSGSVFAGISFFRLRRKLPFVGAGLLAFGFFLWGGFLATYPIARGYPELNAISYLVAAVLQLFIAVSMIVLVLEEVRYKTEKIRAEIAQVRSEKEALEHKIIGAQEEVRRVYDQVRLTEGVQQAYDELRRTQAAVVQQERLRALGQMASGIAHDINNALSPITGYADLLALSHPELPEHTRSYLGYIQTSARDIASIVERMGDFYRPRAAQERLRPTDLNRLTEEVVDLTRPRWRNVSQRQGVSIQVSCELAPGLPRLLCDPSEIREALVNLIFNAVDALPRGGQIVCSTGLIPAAEPAADPSVRIEVRDNGEGMDEATRQRCLEPFFTTKAQRGSGLGLSMIYGMVRRHDGSIDIESTPGEGTTIRLVLPCRSAPVAPRPILPSAAPFARSARVLCVDDEPKIRALVSDCLTVFGHQVTTVSNGPDALRFLAEKMATATPFDLLLTDLGMPDMDGRQLARQARALYPNLPVIMMTGWGSIMANSDEDPAIIDAVLGKPPRLEELSELIARLTTRAARTRPA